MLALTPTLTVLHFLCLHRNILIFQIATQLVWLSPSSVPGLLEGAGAAAGCGLDVECLQQACMFKHVLSSDVWEGCQGLEPLGLHSCRGSLGVGLHCGIYFRCLLNSSS